MSAIGSVTLGPAGWHEHEGEACAKMCIPWARWSLNINHLLPLIPGGGGISLLFWRRRKFYGDGDGETGRTEGSRVGPFHGVVRGDFHSLSESGISFQKH